MGGVGSGRYLRLGRKSKRLVADHEVTRLDVRELYKDSFFDCDARGTITWFRYGREAGGIRTYYDPCLSLLHLDYEIGCPPVPVTERISFTFSACNFGGDRRWFLCPACGRRCAILWGRGRFLCRQCQRVAYASQNESAGSRAMRRIHEIRKKLKVETWVPVSSIERPRYMRYDQYRSLIFELAQHEAVRTGYILGLAASLDQADDELDYLPAERLRAA